MLSSARAVAAAFLLAVGMHASAQSMTVPQREALTAAEEWLGRVDQGQYADAWKAAADPFRKEVSREAFVRGAPPLRKDLGKVISRKGEKIAYVGETPDPSDPTAVKPGMKIAIHFDTKFAGGKTATEEMTMLLEGDGVWRPVGYYLQ